VTVISSNYCHILLIECPFNSQPNCVYSGSVHRVDLYHVRPIFVFFRFSSSVKIKYYKVYHTESLIVRLRTRPTVPAPQIVRILAR